MFSRITQKKVFWEILGQIKHLITIGTLKPGSRLPSERQMSVEMGVSRAAIREAIRALELMGIVHCAQGEGNFLIDNLERCLIEPLSIMFTLGCNEVTQIQQLRHGLEVRMAGLAAALITEQEILRLEEICRRIETDADERTSIDLDLDFHYAIAGIAQNPIILSVFNAASFLIEDLIADIRLRINSDRHTVDQINHQHVLIVEALRRRDSDMSASRMEEHMQLVEASIEKYNLISPLTIK